MVSTGIGSGFGFYNNGLRPTLHGMAGALFVGKQVKREGSILDAKPAHLYLTNQRIVLCRARLVFFGRGEKSVGTPLVEVPYKNIRGVSVSSKWSHPAMDIAVEGPNGIDNMRIFLASLDRGAERDRLIGTIRSHLCGGCE